MHASGIQKSALLGILFLLISLGATAQQDSLQAFRKEIDSLDQQLIRILGKRMEVVTEVGKYKAVHHIAPLQTKRFEELVQKNILLGKDVQLSEAFIRRLMDAIHEESLSKEKLLQK
jgi:chorismate mutase